MSESSARQVAPRSTPSLALACSLLAALALIAGLAAGCFAYGRQGISGLLAVVVADLVCWLSATAALLLAGSLRNTPHAVSGVLGGTLVRLSVPLAAVAICRAAAPSVSQAGLFGYAVLFFLLMLVVETALLVRIVGISSVASGAKASPRAV